MSNQANGNRNDQSDEQDRFPSNPDAIPRKRGRPPKTKPSIATGDSAQSSSETEDVPAKRGPGRPPGAGKRPYELVIVNDLQCPACKRTVSKVLESPYRPATLSYEHIAEDGFVYNRIIWQNRQCECGQFIRVKKRQFI